MNIDETLEAIEGCYEYDGVTMRSMSLNKDKARALLAEAFLEMGTERARLKELLDRDQTGLAAALAGILRQCKGSLWISESRGCYAWDDDRYRDETGHFVRRVISIAEAALQRSGTLANKAFHPEGSATQTFEELERDNAQLQKALDALRQHAQWEAFHPNMMDSEGNRYDGLVTVYGKLEHVADYVLTKNSRLGSNEAPWQVRPRNAAATALREIEGANLAHDALRAR